MEDGQTHNGDQLFCEYLFYQSWFSGGGSHGWFLLATYGYQAGASVQSPQAIHGIVMLFTLIPAMGYLITAGIVRLLKVDRETMRTIQADLAIRRHHYQELKRPSEVTRP